MSSARTTKLWTRAVGKLRFTLESLFNAAATHVPSHHLRQTWLRVLGADIGDGCAIFRGVTVLGVEHLRIGERCTIGWGCVLDARGGLTIGNDVVISSGAHVITADHDPRSSSFDVRFAPVFIDSYAWIATASIILKGVTVGKGSVVAAGSVVVKDTPPYAIVGGIPTRYIADRPKDLNYKLMFRPFLY